jgi:hypothetical protein
VVGDEHDGHAGNFSDATFQVLKEKEFLLKKFVKVFRFDTSWIPIIVENKEKKNKVQLSIETT